MPIYSAQIGKHRLNLLSVHIPKTGGTALSAYFINHGFTQHFSTEHRVVRPVMRCPPQHYEYSILDTLFRLESFHYTFAIVRHPIKRLLSDYKWAMTKSTMADNPMPLDEWVDEVFRSYESNPYYLANHIRPQHHFIGPKIRRTYKLEDGLENALIDVFSNCGLVFKTKVEVERINTSVDIGKDLDVSSIMSTDLRNKILGLYGKDFELFSYEYDA